VKFKHAVFYTWATLNLHVTRRPSFQQGFSVKVWTVDDYVIGPYVIQDRLGGANQGDFLEETLPILLKDGPLH
jgi:hypothetical protein